MQENRWRPDYSERYYTVNTKFLDEIQNAENLHLAVNRFMWLDIDDDFKALKQGLVFHTESEAMEYATAAWKNGGTGAAV